MSADGDTVRDALTFYASVDPVWCPPEQAQGALAALARLEAAADAWMTPFDGSGIEWHEHQIGWKYTYEASDFSKLVAAVHEYEVRCLRTEAQRDALAEALRQIIAEYEVDPGVVDPDYWAGLDVAINIARAALAEAGLE